MQSESTRNGCAVNRYAAYSWAVISVVLNLGRFTDFFFLVAYFVISLSHCFSFVYLGLF